MKEKNTLQKSIDKAEHDFKTNTLETELKRLGINPDCLSDSFKEQLEKDSYISKLKKYSISIGGTVIGKLPIKINKP